MGEIYCKSCYSFEFGAKARFRPMAGRMNRARSVPKMFANNADDILARSTVETWVIKGEKGDADVCRKCCGKVYEAEKITSAVTLATSYLTAPTTTMEPMEGCTVRNATKSNGDHRPDPTMSTIN